MANRILPDVADKLLEKLSTDDDFRSLFEQDPHAALAQIGHVTPQSDRGVIGQDPVMEFKNLRGGLASKETIAAARAELSRAYRTGQSLAGGAGVFNQFDFCAE